MCFWIMLHHCTNDMDQLPSHTTKARKPVDWRLMEISNRRIVFFFAAYLVKCIPTTSIRRINTVELTRFGCWPFQCFTPWNQPFVQCTQGKLTLQFTIFTSSAIRYMLFLFLLFFYSHVIFVNALQLLLFSFFFIFFVQYGTTFVAAIITQRKSSS